MIIDTAIIDSAKTRVIAGLKCCSYYSPGQFCPPDYDTLAENTSESFPLRIWNKALQAIDGFRYEEPVVRARAVIAACISAGVVDKKNVRRSPDGFLLTLPHLEYIVCNEVSGFTAFPLHSVDCYDFPRVAIGLSGERFAEFLLAFDGIVPAIRDALGEILSALRTALMERDKQRKIYEILATVWEAGGAPPKLD